MGSLIIKNANVVTKTEVQDGFSVYCANGKILKVIPENENQEGAIDIDKDIPLDAVSGVNDVIDATGYYLAPGYIDLHIHGAKNLLVDRGKGHLEKLCRTLPQYGVTAFLPTVCPMSSDAEDIGLLSSLASLVVERTEGAQILGFFLEGHYLALTGAFSKLPEVNLSHSRVEEYFGALHPYKVVFGISPELNGITDLLPLMTRHGYPAFITHTAATVRQTEEAIDSGAHHATHFYDVFPYPGEKDLGVRNCGAVEAVLANPLASVDFILDGEHVDPVALKMAIACKGVERVSLITDANINAGLPPGKYMGVDDSEVEVLYEGGPARLGENTRYPGALNGSGLTMDKAVKNALKYLEVDVHQAIAMASSSPARVLGLQNCKGDIKPGYDADMILLDKELNVVRSWIGQKCHYGAAKQR